MALLHTRLDARHRVRLVALGFTQEAANRHEVGRGACHLLLRGTPEAFYKINASLRATCRLDMPDYKDLARLIVEAKDEHIQSAADEQQSR